MSNLETIREFVDAWSTLDANQLSAYFTDDGTYHNMPAKPVVGKHNIKLFIEKFMSTWTETNWVILNIAADGDVVFCERVDKTKTSRGNVDLPCLGIFEMRAGKIHVWRDYFDMGTYINAMS
jgi:limonene-1,2-epoxide hydrolase